MFTLRLTISKYKLLLESSIRILYPIHQSLVEGPMTSLIQIIFLLLDVLWYLIVVQVIMSWLVNFGILNMSQPLIIQIWGSINRLLEPVYRPIRNFLPATGGLDIAPLVVIVGIIIIRIIIVNNFASFV